MMQRKKITVGIDVGAESTKVVLGSAFSCEIVRSNAGLHTTPTAVAFQGNMRLIGETATHKGSNGILHLNRLLSLKEDDPLQNFYQFQHDIGASSTTVTVDYSGETKQFSSSAVLAMLLSGVRKRVLGTIQRMQASTEEAVQEDEVQYFISIAPDTDAGTKEQFLDAAFAAGLGDHTQLVESSVAYASAYQRKFPHVREEGKVVMIIDMGHAQTTVSVVKFCGDPSTPFVVLSTQTNTALGAASVEARLWHHYQSTLPKLSSVTPSSRPGQRLLRGAHELKHLLSQLPEGSVTVENVGDQESDVVLHGTRAMLAELCEPDAEILRELIRSALHNANNNNRGDTTDEGATENVTVDAVEVLGGGCRIPWVQAVIQDTVESGMTLSRSLDDTSAALGAALVGELDSLEGFVVPMLASDEVRERRKELREQEIAMTAMDMDETAKADIRNRIEAKVLELRSAQSGKHGALLTSGELDEYLNGLDDWLFSEEADMATREQMEAKEAEMQAKTKELCGEYFSTIEKEEAAKEKEMEEEAKKAQMENDANGDDEDHDNRRLPKKRRMEIVMKNKEEANELFKDGNWRFAAARYTKALTHCAKFVDLAPDDVKEVTELKVTLNLNLALAYMKMSNVDQALRVCNEALALDDSSAKAYYRRASVFYEKKRWDDAKKDITKAKTLAENDKAIEKLGERIDLELKKQKQKEKKMAAKMFG